MRENFDTESFSGMAGLGSELLMPASAKPFLEQPAENQLSNVALRDLRSFAKVCFECEKIRVAYELSINSAEGYWHSEDIQSEARSKLDQLLAKEGLTAEFYRRMIKTLNADPGLRAKTMRLVHRERRQS
jgi:hypothetical protein